MDSFDTRSASSPKNNESFTPIPADLRFDGCSSLMGQTDNSHMSANSPALFSIDIQ